MIDRSREHFCLRFKTLFYTGVGSLVLFAVLPALSLLSLVAGPIAYGACFIPILVLALLGIGLAILGIICALGGLLGGEGEAACGGGVLAVVGFACLAGSDALEKPLQAGAEAAMAGCTRFAGFLVSDLFLDRWFFLWSCAPFFVMLLCAGLILLTIEVLNWMGSARVAMFGTGYACPACGRHSTPYLRCPECSEVVTDLGPSRYGVFYARCGNCRRRLPTLDLLGRGSLERVCPFCFPAMGHPQSASHPSVSGTADNMRPHVGPPDPESSQESNVSGPSAHVDPWDGLVDQKTRSHRDVHIAIVGAQSSGKSCLLAVSTWQFIRHIARPKGIEVTFPIAETKQTLEKGVYALARGELLPKTAPVPLLRPLTLCVKPASGKGYLLNLYDAAGEDFAEEATMLGHGCHCLLNGVLLVVDPFAEAAVGRQVGKTVGAWNPRNVNPAVSNVAAVFEPFLNRLEQQLRVPAKGVFPIPIAVVITKAFADGLKHHLGTPSRLRVGSRGLAKLAWEAERRSPEVRDRLSEFGLDNLLGVIETRFARVAYFATSAVEQIRSQERGVVDSYCAALPLVWLIENARKRQFRSTTGQLFRDTWTAVARPFGNRDGTKAKATP